MEQVLRQVVQIRSFSGSYFPLFGLNTEIYSVNLRIQSKYGKIRTRKTLYLDAVDAVKCSGGKKERSNNYNKKHLRKLSLCTLIRTLVKLGCP